MNQDNRSTLDDQAVASYPSACPVLVTGLDAYRIGLDAGRRREDPVHTTYAALTSWRVARGEFAACELIAQFYCGWFSGSSTWFDTTEGGGS
jgi:hypothetical protein